MAHIRYQAVPLEPDGRSWTSPVMEPGFPFTELVPTWHGRTPGAGWLEVSVRVRTWAGAADSWTRWLTLAHWADHDDAIKPTSVDGERDGPAEVDTDTLRVAAGADAWQLRVIGHAGAELTYLGALTSGSAEDGEGAGQGEMGLDVPALSQRIHTGHYPQWGGGGQSWCSPTCVSMILRYWGAGPEPAAYDWVDPAYPARAVYHAVRHTWDAAYGGAGNWSFNAAYAAGFGLTAFVTRLRGLPEAEQFIRAGIPLVASVRVDPAQLSGADYRSSGHLVVITGFTGSGDVRVNDPGAQRPETVPRTYRGDEFDHAWRWGSGRIIYVIHPPTMPLPPPPAEPNW